VILRSIVRMNMAVGILRGWRDCLLADSAVSAEKRQDFSCVIEKYLIAAERNGWAVGVESMKVYIKRVSAWNCWTEYAPLSARRYQAIVQPAGAGERDDCQRFHRVRARGKIEGQTGLMCAFSFPAWNRARFT
jgi:hypothetical protein